MEPVERFVRVITYKERIQQLAGELLAIDDTTTDPQECASLRAAFSCLGHAADILEEYPNPQMSLFLRGGRP